MQGMTQSNKGQVERGGSPVIWPSGRSSGEASTLELEALEINLLPELEEFLRESMLDKRKAPGREGLLG
jgi:hypothetical protein